VAIRFQVFQSFEIYFFKLNVYVEWWNVWLASKGDLQPGPQGRLWGDGNAAACKLLRMEVDLPPLYGSYVKRKLGQCYDLVSQRLRGRGSTL